MKPLRVKFCEFMQLRNLAPKTQESYLHSVVQLSKYYNKSPYQIGQEQIFEYILYLGTGLRLAELVNLKVKDIDGQRMTIFVHNSKGKKDRYTILPKKLLVELQHYYRLFKPKEWLFHGYKPAQQMSVDSISKAFREAKRKAGLAKEGGIHTLRHCFATHLLEEGCDIRTVQHLLGHSHISTTAVYLHVTNKLISKVESPLEKISTTPFDPSPDDQKEEDND